MLRIRYGLSCCSLLTTRLLYFYNSWDAVVGRYATEGLAQIHPVSNIGQELTEQLSAGCLQFAAVFRQSAGSLD